MSDRRGWRLWAGWLLGLMLGGLSFLTLCDLSFDCGCVAPGMGDWQHCDIQTAGPPDCPWCKTPTISAGGYLRLSITLTRKFSQRIARLSKREGIQPRNRARNG